MQRDDLMRMRYMLGAAKEAIAMASKNTMNDLAANRMLLPPIVRHLQIIGEAARRVSEETRQRHGTIAWPHFIKLREHAADANSPYESDLVHVWHHVKNDLPRLVTDLERIVGLPEL